MKRLLTGKNAPIVAYFTFWFLYFAVFWARAFTDNAAGGITAGHVNLWGDWAVHFTMGSAMAYRRLLLDQSPLLIYHAFKYPFFVNLLSALFVRAGMPFFSAFTVPSFVFSIATVVALYVFFRVTTGSSTIAIIASLLYLSNGGLGFIQFGKDVAQSPKPWFTAFHPPHTYTRFGDIYWINIVECMIIPQRSFEIGFPMALFLLTLLFRWWGPRLAEMPLGNSRALPPIVVPAVIGMLVGFLPIVHVHSFAAAALVAGTWMSYDLVTRARPLGQIARWWAVFWMAAALIAVPIILYFFIGGSGLPGFRWAPGWYAAETGENWIMFWVKNWGPTPALACAGLAGCLGSPRARATAWFIAPFIVIFAVGNLFIFHPWIWDNTKVLCWGSVGICLAAALFLRLLWRDTSPFWPVSRAAAIVLFAASTASGAIDLYRIQIPRLNTHQMYSNEDLYLADWVKKNAPIDSVWLTGDYHNHFLFNLTGRQAVMTYPGWLWTHGYNYTGVESDVQTMYEDPYRDDLFRKYKVDYVVVGPNEKKELGASDAFAQRFPIAIQTEKFTIYQVSGTPPSQPRIQPGSRLEALLPLTAQLSPGLIRRTYHDRYCFGPHRTLANDTDINFRYDEVNRKPFAVPASIEWDGYIRVPIEDIYRFSLASDDGSVLLLDDSVLIDNGGVHMIREETGTVRLGEGYHRIRLRYFDAGGGAVLSLRWSSGGGPLSLDADSLYH